VPTGADDVELPGIAADPSAGGRVALAYYRVRGSALTSSSRRHATAEPPGERRSA